MVTLSGIMIEIIVVLSSKALLPISLTGIDSESTTTSLGKCTSAIESSKSIILAYLLPFESCLIAYL